MAKPIEMTATEALAAMANGDMSAADYAAALIKQAKSHKDLNVFIHFDADDVMAKAKAADEARAKGGKPGPLTGLPVILKDNIDTDDAPTTAGTHALRDHRPSANAPVWQTLLDAGAYAFGKANMHELAYGITSNNGCFGPVHNPYARDRIPGGSSGGSGAGVAARFAPVGLGSDTGGSVRVPAGLCGIVGFRPTTMRYSQAGVVPISSTRDTIGPLTRSVADAALIDGIVTGAGQDLEPASLDRLKIGVPRGYYYDNLHPETARQMNAALERLASYGVDLVEANVPDVGPVDEACSFPIALYETVVTLNEYLRSHGAGIDYGDVVARIGSPDVKGLLESLLGEGAIPEQAYLQAVGEIRPKLRQIFRDYFADTKVKAIVFPTTPLPAAKIGEDETVMLNGQELPTFPTFIRNTDPASMAALPGLTLPIGLTSDGLPVGMEFDGPEGSDREILAIGLALEAREPAMPPPAI